MVIREKFAGLKRYIADEGGAVIYEIKYKGLFERSKCICDLRGRVIYDIAENKDCFTIKNRFDGSELHVKTGKKVKTVKTEGEPFKLSFYGEFYISEKEICVKYGNAGSYDIFLKGEKAGVINKKTADSEIISDRGLLAALYVFSNCILGDERMNTAANLVNISV